MPPAPASAMVAMSERRVAGGMEASGSLGRKGLVEDGGRGYVLCAPVTEFRSVFHLWVGEGCGGGAGCEQPDEG